MTACTFWKQSVFPPLGILFNGPMFCCYHILCLASAPSASLRMTLSSSLFFCSYTIPKSRTYTKTLYLHYKMGSLPSTHPHTHTHTFLEVFYYPSVCGTLVRVEAGQGATHSAHCAWEYMPPTISSLSRLTCAPVCFLPLICLFYRHLFTKECI